MAEGAPSLRLQLLGPLVVGDGIRLPTRKAEALLAYLALPAGRAHRRDTLSGLLWGDRSEKQARHSLSQTLFSLRKTLSDALDGASPLITDGDAVALAAEMAEIDVDIFERHCAEGSLQSLAAAAALYRGELLQGLSLREIGLDDWLAAERSRLRERAIGVFSRLSERHAEARQTDLAVQATVRLLALDPLQEAAHRGLMRLYLAQGRPAAALRQYERCVEILRRELGVEPEAETRALRAEITRRRQTAPAPPTTASPPPPSPPAAMAPAAAPVGREDEMGRLEGWLEAALGGRRRIVFLAGEAGIGKTTLIDGFLAHLADRQPPVPVGRGQCIDHRGGAEPYLPVLEALSALCRHSEDILARVAAHAPTWVAQLPGIAGTEAAPPMATRERMLREMSETLEAITATSPLVLVIEDLHWGDVSTLDLIEAAAHRRQPARLLILATYRRADVAAHDAPVRRLAQTLRIRGLAEELSLGGLDGEGVARYLARRFPAAPPPRELVEVLRRRAGGNPLFMSNLVCWWLERGAIVDERGAVRLADGMAVLERGVPDDLGFLVEQQFASLEDAERQALEAASVAGDDFAGPAVAAALEIADEEAEARLAGLARKGLFIREHEERRWPDGTLHCAFSFLHQLYRESLYGRLATGRRARLHRRIGERIERAFAGAAAPASELAMHFRLGQDAPRAVFWLDAAASQAMQRSAHREVVGLLKEALDLIPVLPEAERPGWELRLRNALAPALATTEGFTSAAAEQTYRRACDLARQLGDRRRLSNTMFGLATLLEMRGDYGRTREVLGERMIVLDSEPDPAARVESEELFACSNFHHGHFKAAVAHAEAALATYDARRDLATITAMMGDNAAVACFAWSARSLWFLGRPDEALERARSGIEAAHGDGHSFALALAHEQAARLYQHRGEPQAALDHAGRAASLGEALGFPYRAAAGSILHGWARAMLGDPAQGIAEIEGGLATCRMFGAALEYPYFLALLAEARRLAGDDAAARRALEAALAQTRISRGFFYEAEILRALAQLDLASDPVAAETRLREALAVSRRQRSRPLETRAAADLAALWRHQGRTREAEELLAGEAAPHELARGPTDGHDASRDSLI